jgi:rhamnosyltransferase
MNPHSHSQSMIAAVVTYRPPQDFEQHLEQLYSEFDKIILIDNGSPSETQEMLRDEVRRRDGNLILILNPKNLGIATALNQGFDWASRHKYDFVISLDQDSLPAPGITKALLQAYDAHLHRDKIAIVAPMVEDPNAGIIARYLRPRHFLLFERKGCSGHALEDVSIVITSGSMYNLKIYQQLGPFRDDFFIDYVDTEYCLRAKKQGFNIIVACNAHLHHRLGNQQRFRVGPLELRPTFHSVIRWYYISRNRIPMIRQYGIRFPHWLLYELIINSYGFLRMLCLEDHKLGKILAVLLGSLDGLAGRSGEIPDYRQNFLSRFE